MSDEKEKMPMPDSLPGLLLTLTALSGELPSSQIYRMPSTKSYQEKVVKELKQKRLLRTYFRHGLRGLRLTAAAKKMLLANHPDWFSPCLTGDVETNLVKSEIVRRLRLHRMAEMLVTMNNTGVYVFPWEKSSVFQLELPPPGCRIDLPAYYSSREIKEIGPSSNKIRNSRAVGVLFADDSVFTIYNAGPFQMKWEYKAEMRFKYFMQIEVCRSRLKAQFGSAGHCAVVFGAGMDQLDTMLGVGDGLSHNHFVLDGSYDHFYFLTSDQHGETLLRFLCDGNLRVRLDAILMEDLSPPLTGSPIENDAMVGDTPVLFGYTCDMPRLRRFDTALSLHMCRGLVICFDFQEEAYRRCLGSQIRFQSLDYEQVMALVVNAPS